MARFQLLSGETLVGSGQMSLKQKVTIHTRSGEQFMLTGFPAKKLQSWLLQLGIPHLK